MEEADAVARPVGREAAGDGECDEVAAAAASTSHAVSRVLCVFGRGVRKRARARVGTRVPRRTGTAIWTHLAQLESAGRVGMIAAGG